MYNIKVLGMSVVSFSAPERDNINATGSGQLNRQIL